MFYLEAHVLKTQDHQHPRGVTFHRTKMKEKKKTDEEDKFENQLKIRLYDVLCRVVRQIKSGLSFDQTIVIKEPKKQTGRTQADLLTHMNVEILPLQAIC